MNITNNKILSSLNSENPDSDNIPRLRFPEFKGKWEKKKLGEVVKINQGLQIDISERFTEKVEGSFFYITNQFLKANSEKTYFIKNPPNSVLCTKEDILMTRTGNTGMVVTNVEGAFHNNFFKVAYPDYINKNFLYNFLKLENTQNQILRMAGTSTIPDLNHSDFYRIFLPFPTLTEQTKIAEFFTAIDAKIQALKKKKSLLENYKKGIMQKLFSQELRFKDENGQEFAEWEEMRLEEVCKIAKSGGTPTSTNKNYYNGDIPFLSISDITAQGKYLTHTSNHISKLGLENSSSWIVPENSLIYSMYASVGFVAINKIPIATSQAVLNLILKDEFDLEFMYYTLVDFQKNIAQFITTGTQGNLNAQSVKNFELKIPSLSEQIKISNFLSNIDEKINHTKMQIQQTEMWKKGLLQKMFV